MTDTQVVQNYSPNPPTNLKVDEFTFLNSYHSELWSSIRHKEQNILAFLGLYSAAVGILAGLGTQLSDIRIIAFVVMLLSFWGMFIALDAYWWWRNNMLIVNNTQKYLFGTVAHTILPQYYFSPKIARGRIYAIHLTAMSLIVIWVFVAYVLTIEPITFRDIDGVFYFLLNFAFVIIGISVLRGRARKDRTDLDRFVREAPGIVINEISAREVLRNKVIPGEHDAISEENKSRIINLASLSMIGISSIGQLLVGIYGYRVDLSLMSLFIWFLIPIYVAILTVRRVRVSNNLNFLINEFTNKIPQISIEKPDEMNKLKAEYSASQAFSSEKYFKHLTHLIDLLVVASLAIFLLLSLPVAIQAFLAWLKV